MLEQLKDKWYAGLYITSKEGEELLKIFREWEDLRGGSNDQG